MLYVIISLLYGIFVTSCQKAILKQYSVLIILQKNPRNLAEKGEKERGFCMKRKSKANLACFTLLCVCAGLTGCGKETVDVSADADILVSGYDGQRMSLAGLALEESLYDKK